MENKVSFFLVGGAVRDKILGLEPKDRDYVVVGADVQWMLDRGFKQVGAAFPVFLHPETGEEYALARKEKKVAAGYQGFEFEFGPHVTLEDDLLRRDLTMNAIAEDQETGLIIDPFNGRNDLKLRVIRHTSIAFAEDPLRVLRVARFAARYGFKVHEDTKLLCRTLVNSGELDALSADRVWTEVTKLLSEKHPSLGVVFLSDLGCGALDTPRLSGLFAPEAIMFDAETEEKLTLAEKQFMFLNVHVFNNDQLAQFRVPSDVARYSKFMSTMIDVMLEYSIDMMTLVKAFDSFRAEIKAGKFDEFVALGRKVGDSLCDEDEVGAVQRAFAALLKLDFTELVKGMKPSEIKSFVLKTKLDVAVYAVLD